MTHLNDPVFDFLLADYLRPECPTAAACIRRVRACGELLGWQVPSEPTLRKRLKAFRIAVPAVVILAREGVSALANFYDQHAQASRVAQSLPAETI